MRRIDVESAAQMHDAVMQEIAGTDIFIATAAVADYRPAAPADCKIKKVTDSSMDLHGAHRRHPRHGRGRSGADRPLRGGLRRRNRTMSRNMRGRSCKRKNLDLIAANEVGDNKVFEQDDNALLLLWPRWRARNWAPAPRPNWRAKLMDFIAERYRERKSACALQPRGVPADICAMQQLNVRVLDARIGTHLAAARLRHRRIRRARPARLPRCAADARTRRGQR